ncbi:hypothetical protein PHYSODRAFT_527421 [Phytophthora sojae]|uniref:Uncharacterized protein n=1 Tax=Phytophthora sojae (strain P6497) TaxID=1094619 RepID=G5A7P0_PHYSP|nr:hypothetical protein PHYSODRAFT_527421 [Phytophthora sojae]EGZ07916.1 hypothetical protein PHYSODRAFT_527421 [Phytophthora sojae]|eukprot:XP_009536088.1 hypothetical protein PHYSODRAFT_527421 [Phytophthora sojae]
MAEHLRGATQRRDFQEPLPPLDQLEKLFTNYEADIPLDDFLHKICATRPETTPVAKFPLVIDSKNFFQGVAIPKIMDLFLRDNGNELVEKLIKKRVFGTLQKRFQGGLSLLVRTSADQVALVGQQVSIMGTKFRFTMDSPLARCYYLDVAGVSSQEEASAILRALALKGAKPVYFRPCALDKASGLLSNLEILLSRGGRTGISRSRWSSSSSCLRWSKIIPMIWKERHSKRSALLQLPSAPCPSPRLCSAGVLGG